MDFEAEGLLDGLEDGERAARLQLLERLVADGFQEDEIRAAVAEDRLPLLPVERVLGGRYTAKEVEERAGLPRSALTHVRRVLGLPEAAPEDRVYDDEDLQAAESIQLFYEAGFGQEGLDEITRVLGEAMSRVAAATTAAFAQAFLKPGDSEDAVASRFAQLTESLTPALNPVLASAYRAHLRENVRRGMISRAELAAGQIAGEQELTVCFADLVGFTRLGGQLEAGELGGVVGTFIELAADAAQPPVRLIKTIGDAAMLTSREPAPLVSAALSLLDAVQERDLPTLRAGIACGRALPRAGDLYGHAVNLASRVTGAARPGSVLCTKEVHDAATEGFEWSFAGRHRLKGIGDAVPLYRARPAGGEEAVRPDSAPRPRTADRRRR